MTTTPTRWTACVAPLNVEEAQRSLGEGPWRLYPTALLVTIDAGRQEVGTVDTLTVVDGELRASGTVTDPDTAARIRSGDLKPALELGEQGARDDAVRYEHFETADGFTDARIRFEYGVVAAVALTDHPSWPDRVWITIDTEGTR